jgi:hypothetical protein
MKGSQRITLPEKPDARRAGASTDATLLAVALSALVVVPAARAVLVLLRSPGVGLFHDDGIYLVTAKALASGAGYRIISLPDTPFQTKYPILFPFVLSLVWRAVPSFPANLVWLRLVPLIASVGWLGVSWRVMRRAGTPVDVTILAVALTVVSPWTIFLSTTLLSETVFGLFVGLGVLLLSRESNDGSSAFASGLFMGAAVLTRTAGIGTGAGGLLYLALNRRWSACARYILGAALVSLPWFVWSGLHGSDPIIDPFYSAANYRSWNVVFNYAWPDKLAIVGLNAFSAIQVGQFWGLPFDTWPAWGAAGVCTAWALRGLWIERQSPTTLVCLPYLALLFAWAFPPLRFMVPILPFLLRSMFVGAGRMKPVAVGVVGVLALTGGLATWQLAQASAARGGTWFNASQVDDWRGIQESLDWVNDHVPNDAVLIATHDPTFFLFTGRRAVRPDSMDPVRLYYNIRGLPFDADADAEALRQRILQANADYVVITPRDAPKRLERLSARFPGTFAVVHGTRESRHVIYHIDRFQLAGSTER